MKNIREQLVSKLKSLNYCSDRGFMVGIDYDGNIASWYPGNGKCNIETVLIKDLVQFEKDLAIRLYDKPTDADFENAADVALAQRCAECSSEAYQRMCLAVRYAKRRAFKQRSWASYPYQAEGEKTMGRRDVYREWSRDDYGEAWENGDRDGCDRYDRDRESGDRAYDNWRHGGDFEDP